MSTIRSSARAAAAVALLGVLPLSGCASREPREVFERGWLGGKYQDFHPSVPVEVNVRFPDYSLPGEVPKLEARADGGEHAESGPNPTAAPPARSEADLVQTRNEYLELRNEGGPPVTEYSVLDEYVLCALISEGAQVVHLTEDCPAKAAGIMEGDVITFVNDEEIESVADLQAAVRDLKPGGEALVRIARAGKAYMVHVVAGREKYERCGSITFGLGISDQLDLIPNPDFSWFALVSFERETLTPELEDPADRASALTNGNSWNFWLIFFGFGKFDRLVSQESYAPAPKNNPLR